MPCALNLTKPCNVLRYAFLAENLGGRYQPIGEAFQGADFSIPDGEEGVPGVKEALKTYKPKAKEPAKGK